MAYTLFDLLVDVYDELGKLNVGQATGGSVTTIVDTALSKDVENNAWQNGAYFIISTTDGLTPQSLMGLITASGASAQSFTFATIATAVASGDRYGYTSPEYPLYQVIQACNRGLRSLGTTTDVDISLTVASQQTEYALPVALKRNRLRQVWVATNTDSNHQEWHEIRGYRVEPDGPGSTGLLILPNYDYPTYTLKLIYDVAHDNLRDSTDIVSEYVDPELAKWACVHAALKWQNGRVGGNNEGVREDLLDAKDELANAKRMFKIWKPKRVPKTMEVWSA